jgi:prepilin-type N-terminal cleavage/methylation domain-containing protein
MTIHRSPWHRLGFTLIEVLVVVSIVGLLAALLIPAVQWARAAARRTTCASNLRQLGLATLGYQAVFNIFPTSASGSGHSVFVALMPHMEQNALFSSINMSEFNVALAANLNRNRSAPSLVQ